MCKIIRNETSSIRGQRQVKPSCRSCTQAEEMAWSCIQTRPRVSGKKTQMTNKSLCCLKCCRFWFTKKNLHSAIRVMHGQNGDIHGSMVSIGAGAVCMTDDSCSLHWSHMASALCVWLYACSALKSSTTPLPWELTFLAKGENVIVVYQNVAFLILKHETEHTAEMSLLEPSHQGTKHIV